MYVFDGRDRSIVTEQEIERYWNSDRNAAIYKESSQDKAVAFDLKPGLGVHVPLLFPHWVKNGPDVSVSVSVNFEFEEQHIPNVYRANYYLRKLGFQPGPPGRSRWKDALKEQAFRTFQALRQASSPKGQKSGGMA
jgi:hypothetical protein